MANAVPLAGGALKRRAKPATGPGPYSSVQAGEGPAVRACGGHAVLDAGSLAIPP